MERLDKRSLTYVAKRSFREFMDDQCTDLAAALTYYAVLSIFPAAIALTSLLGLVTDPQKSVQTVIDVLKPIVSNDMLGNVQPVLEDLANSQGAGFALLAGLAGALWTASGYVGAFSRAMNSIYEVEEGRPFWKLRPQMLLVTIVSLVLLAAVVFMLIVSGPVAQSIGDVIGLGDEAVLAWNIAKWPVLAVCVMVLVALLYWATPNVQHPKFRWLSPGAALALVAGAAASFGFSVYLNYFGNYNKTYGSLAGVIIALLFIWIVNLALLLGAELDSELERGRELEAGVPAEEELQLPLRDTSKIRKSRQKEQDAIEEGRDIRQDSGNDPRKDPHTDVSASGIDTKGGNR